MQAQRRRPAQVVITWAGRRLRAARGDDGFFLLESIVAIAIITIIMAALTAFFSNAVKSNNEARQRQGAVQIADAALDSLRAIPATDLVTGRDTADVQAQFNATRNTPVQSWVLGTGANANQSTVMSPISDSTAALGDGTNAVVPTAPKATPPLNGLTYGVSKYVGTCAVLAGGANGNASDCNTANLSQSNITVYYRGVVAVTWPSPHCSNNTCTYVTATLITGAIDPTFNLNQSPAPLPVAVSPGNQVSVVDDQITGVAFTMKNGTGVPPATWQSTSPMPANIKLNPDGTFTGSPSAPTNSPLTITATLTDAFLRTTTASLTWSVQPKLTASAPPPQTSYVGYAISPLNLSATGGSGTPYTWSDPTGSLPPGLTLTTASNQGQISGTPTTAGTYAVSVTVTDPTKHVATVNWTWTIGVPPVVTNPGPIVTTKGAPVSVKLTASGATGTVTWSSSTLPAGLTLNSTTGVISGTPTSVATTSVTVNGNDSGTHITATQTFTWNVVAPPTVTAPSDPNSTATGAETFQLSTNCPNSPCSYALVNGPPGMSISASGQVSGTLTGSAAVYSQAKITVTDASAVSTTSAAFTWTVHAAPSVTVPTQTSFVNTKVSVNANAFVTNGVGPFTFTASGLPSGLSLNASTGMITGNSSPTKATTNGVTISATDANGVTTTSAAFTWVTNDLRLDVPDQWSTPGNTVSSIDLDNFVTGGTAPFSFTTANLPNWLSYNATTHVISGTAPAAKTQASISLTVTDGDGASAVDSFVWYDTSLKLTLGDQVTKPGAAVNLDVDGYVTNGSAYAISVSGLPSWLSYSTTTHVISGTAPASASTTSGIVVTIRETSGSTFSFTRSITWYVSGIRWSGQPTSIPIKSTATANYAMGTYVVGAAAPSTFRATGLPANWSIDPATGTITSTGTTATGTYSVTVTVTDSTGAFSSTPITVTVT